MHVSVVSPTSGAWNGLSTLESWIGSSPAILRLRDIIDEASQTHLPVLMTGETGTGKDLAAGLIHRHSSRRDRAYEVVLCPTLLPSTAVSELFGHERDAFTSADQQHRGAFERTDGGTLLLNEVGDLPLDVQAMLLDVLQTGQVVRLGEGERMPNGERGVRRRR